MKNEKNTDGSNNDTLSMVGWIFIYTIFIRIFEGLLSDDNLAIGIGMLVALTMQYLLGIHTQSELGNKFTWIAQRKKIFLIILASSSLSGFGYLVDYVRVK